MRPASDLWRRYKYARETIRNDPDADPALLLSYVIVPTLEITEAELERSRMDEETDASLS